MQKVVDKMHLIMAANAFEAYPDHNKRLDIYTDASDFQLGACIIQEGRPVAYSRKLTKSQQTYTLMEKGNAFDHCITQRILRYAPWCGHTCFYG